MKIGKMRHDTVRPTYDYDFSYDYDHDHDPLFPKNQSSEKADGCAKLLSLLLYWR
jgi:hypothetical protein